MGPLLKVSDEDKKKGIHKPEKKLKDSTEHPAHTTQACHLKACLASLTEMKRLDDLKAEQEKTKRKLKALSNEELEAQAAQLAAYEAKRKRMLEEYN
ncbi:hypothetical protein Tco_1226656 [Tanacetum coccineum]